MAMKLVRKTAEYKIFLRGDNRYAVQTDNGKPINGEEKVNILIAEELVKVTAPREVAADREETVEDVAVEAVEELAAEEGAPAEEPAEEEAPAEVPVEAPAEEPSGEEAPAEEPTEEEPATEEPADDEEAK